MPSRLPITLACLPILMTAASAKTEAPERAALQRYCSGDLVTFCDGMAPDGPELKACFRAHRAELSPGCLGAIDRFERRQKRG